MTGAVTVLPGFTDAHVHLALIDPAGLAAGGIARVLDLGGWTPAPAGIAVAYAGQFLTAPGGYPGGRSWAPAGSVCEVREATDAAAAVDAQLAAGASVVKVTLNAVGGPVLPAAVLTAIVRHAHERGVPVVAHAEGAGQAGNAWACGVDALAHAPFSERLDDDLLTAMAGRMTWISTLDIHGWGEPDAAFDLACDNVRRFHAAGGHVRYGTDLGNGPLPLGLNRREVDALLGCGLAQDEVIGALTSTRLGTFRIGEPAPGAADLVSIIPGERPDASAGAAAFAAWLCGARAAPAPAPA